MKVFLRMMLVSMLLAGTNLAMSYEKDDWLLRIGAVTVNPDTDSDDIHLPTDLVAQADVDDDTYGENDPVPTQAHTCDKRKQ